LNELNKYNNELTGTAGFIGGEVPNGPGGYLASDHLLVQKMQAEAVK
jgi:hypothetical protein